MQCERKAGLFLRCAVLQKKEQMQQQVHCEHERATVYAKILRLTQRALLATCPVGHDPKRQPQRDMGLKM